ncbi:Serine protease htra2, mitochondrial [Podochytrium sp. JEL0797]|nr:Serine protease htra2, mitochondrial [Podochytrium sp. JEL0797]
MFRIARPLRVAAGMGCIFGAVSIGTFSMIEPSKRKWESPWKPRSAHCDWPLASEWRQRDHRNFVADAVEKVLDSVVNIMLETEVRHLFSSKIICSRGSGFFITSDGKILTNAHVVEDFTDSSKIFVTMTDGREFPARIHAVDFLSDLAILQLIDPTNTIECKPVVLGSNTPLRAGEWVVSIGNPMGLQNTITAGVVSSQRRKSIEIGGLDSRVEYLQTDCVIHSGSSGGPLINLDGEVVDMEGISFAIKVDHAKEMIIQLVDLGRIVRPWLGFGMVSLSPYVWQQLRAGTRKESLPQTETGVLITSIDADSPAWKAGCMEGDVIVEVNGVPIHSASKLLKIIGLQVDDPVKLLIKRIVLRDSENPNTWEPVDVVVDIHPQEYQSHK